jgi:hypothetical protein
MDSGYTMDILWIYYGYTIIFNITIYNLCFDSGTLPPTPPTVLFQGNKVFSEPSPSTNSTARPQQLQTLPQRGRLCGLLVHGGWDI